MALVRCRFSLLALVCACSSADAGADGNAAAADASAPPADAAADARPVVPGEPDARPPAIGWDLLDPRSDGGAWVRVRNLCPFPLWIHAAGSSGVLQPDDTELASGATRDYAAPGDWSAARVTAYRDGPRTGEIEKAEMTLQASPPLVLLNYNVTYVDWVGLPVQVAGAGGECGSTHVVGCDATQSELLDDCPAHLRTGDICLSARSYCLDPTNQASSYCHALDGEISRCAATVSGCGHLAGATTPEAYACSGTLSQEPRLCAALNRGMLDDPDDGNPSRHYVHEPHNTYAAWVHQVCPGLYAFPYDDWLAQGGFRACRGTELRVTFCPAG